jgi:flavoprotein hydroxylase
VTGSRLPATDADVVVVGYGPVGQVLSLLLARRGWRVIVAEQRPGTFTMPRAVTFDGHAARIIAAAGAADVIGSVGEPSADYVVENGTGQVLLRIGLRRTGRHGWPDSTSMYQPGLEAALTARGARQPSLRVLRGHRVTGLSEHAQAVEVATAGTSTRDAQCLRARWVVGCDGANSFVRAHLGTAVSDFGFCADWMACDVSPFRPEAFPPSNLQVADPLGPRVAVSAGHGHRRWEFMRPPDEAPGEFGTAASAWRRLAMFGVTPANARLDRHAVYTVRARCADRWRSGRIMIAGDAAHQMPPFAGQGLCSGIRDAANLAWKLDMVLAGRQDATLLDTYERERKPNASQAIRLSVWLGNLICMVDKNAAARRDAGLLGAARPGRDASPELPDNLADGLVHRDPAGRPSPFAGSVFPQARVGRGGKTGWFDEIAGPGFALLAREDPAALLEADLRAFLHGLGTRFIQVIPGAGGPARGAGRALTDAEGVYLPWLESMRALGALVRPDFYLFGIGRDRAGLAAMVASLRACLGPQTDPCERTPG